MFAIEIKHMPDQPYIGLTHIGLYTSIGTTFDLMSAQVSELGLWPQARAVMATYFDDPMQVAAEDLRSVAGIFVAQGTETPPGMVAGVVKGGRYAILTYIGPYSGIPDAYERLFNEWLPTSGHQALWGPSYEVYPNSPLEVPEAELITEIAVPLAS